METASPTSRQSTEKPRESSQVPDTDNTPSKRNLKAEAAMARHLAAIRRTQVDPDFAYRSEQLMTVKINWLAENCVSILDVGQSARERAQFFMPGQLESVDINDNPGAPPDIIDDICAPSRLKPNRYDGIVCLSVLEHVYDPLKAAENLYALLKPGGRLFLHVPFMFRYHAEADLAFTDCYRFSRDGLAWLLRDFSEVTLYPVRGPYSSTLNLNKFWKKKIEKHIGNWPNQLIDRIGLKLFGLPNSELQVSGYYAWAVK